jgi:Glycosyl transferases group 1
LDPDVRNRTIVSWPERYSWANASQWADRVRDGLAAHVDVRRVEIAQHAGNLVVFEIDSPHGRLRAGLDYDDQLALHPRAPELDLYFKMQHAVGGYPDGNVVPGGYVTDRARFYRLISALRRVRATRRPQADVFGRFGLAFNAEQRATAVRMLGAQRRFSFVGGTGRRRWSRYLEELARSRIAVDLPGRGPLCYRLVECLGLGVPIVGPPPDAELHVPLVPEEHVVRCAPDLHDLVDRCAELLEDEARQKRIGQAAATYFDRCLRPPQLGAYYLATALARAAR